MLRARTLALAVCLAGCQVTLFEYQHVGVDGDYLNRPEFSAGAEGEGAANVPPAENTNEDREENG